MCGSTASCVDYQASQILSWIEKKFNAGGGGGGGNRQIHSLLSSLLQRIAFQDKNITCENRCFRL